jgi:hypothetical protein
MNKFLRIKHIIFCSILTILVIVGIIGSCTSSKNNGNNGNNRTLAQIELNILVFQIKNKIIDVDTLSDKEYIDVGHRFATLVNIIGKVKSQEIHYFRIHFSRAPKVLDEMIKTILDNRNNIFEWELLPWQNMAFHMYGKDGEYNLKFISADGHFEAVYNKNGMLLTQENDPLNMGTFNYAHQLADQMTHYNLDVWPYFMWNNTEEAMRINNAEKIEPVPIDKNEDAMERYKEYEKLLNKK